jgi:hypothetical protein
MKRLCSNPKTQLDKARTTVSTAALLHGNLVWKCILCICGERPSLPGSLTVLKANTFTRVPYTTP